jgi:hypothetical protein
MKPLELIHSNVWNCQIIISYRDAVCGDIYIDDFARFVCVFFMKEKYIHKV